MSSNELIWVEPNSERWLSLEDLPNEEWKDIKDFEGLYQISNYGRVKRLGYWRNHIARNQCSTFRSTYYVKEHILKIKKDNYSRVQLYASADNNKLVSIHKLVALHFIPNLENKPIVDHKNNNTYDNRVDNLQWVTHKENADYSWQRGRERNFGARHKNSKKIGQYSIDGTLLNTYYGSGEASRATGISDVIIRQACRGGRGCKTRKGYIWKYI
jgi:hypothetical protein